MSSSDENDLLLAAASFVLMKALIKKKSKTRRKRRWWMTSLYSNRELYSGMLLSDLQKDGGDHFKNCCRMSYETFNQLLTLVEPKIRKEDTHFRKAIPSNERLALTLRYLATGDSFASLSLVFKISKSSISHIIPEVCTAIIEVLQDNIQVMF